jgi:lipid II:glycine glycyltransferase (peptidoglycan interpeptide bridge formation enzyme)
MPFADHCQPLVGTADELADLVTCLQHTVSSKNCSYFELRCVGSGALDFEAHTGLTKSATFSYHSVNLGPDLESLFRAFHPSCVKRKIRRAQTEGLKYDEGTSDLFLEQFYALLVMTRRRHGLPPQPLAWFRNLRDFLGRAMKIRIVSNAGQALASIVTLQYKNTILYKYGCSDARFHRLGGMPFLFWRTIQEGKKLGMHVLDLGRTDAEARGLITFKEHLGAASSTLNYYRYPRQSVGSGILRKMVFAPRLYARLPNSFLRAAGNFLYRHVG